MVASVLLPQGGSGRVTRVVREQVRGITPDNADWDILRNTGGDGVSSEIETTESNELPGEVLGIRDVIRTGQIGNFTYEFELSANDTFELMFESLLKAPFGVNAVDVLTPADDEITFTIEDWLPTINQGEFILNTKCSSMSLNLEAQQIITGTFTGSGGTTGISGASQVAETGSPGDISIAAGPPAVLTLANGVPSTVEVGSFIRLEGMPGFNGYYQVLDVNGDDITLDGKFAGDFVGTGDPAERVIYFGASIPDGTNGTVTPVNTSPIMRCGNSVDLKINGRDVLEFGLRIPSMTVTIENTTNNLLEITEDDPYAVLDVDRAITMSLDFHVINLFPLEKLLSDEEFSMSLRMKGSDGRGYELNFPRVKSSSANKGPANRGEEMTGTWEVAALLNSQNIAVEITRGTF